MPSVSEKQKKFMRIACNNKEFADKVDISQKVACEFHNADKKLEESTPRFQQALLASIEAEQEMRRRRIAMDDILNHNE